MDTAQVMAALGDALATIPGLRVYPYEADQIMLPAGLVDEPETIAFDETMRRGADRGDFTVLIAVARVDARSSSLALAPYRAGSGEKSVKAAVEAHVTDAWDSVRVKTAERGYVVIGDISYLSAKFTIDIIGRGA